MTKNPEKKATTFIAAISVTILMVIVIGGIFVYHQQLADERNGLWEPIHPLMKTDFIPVVKFTSTQQAGQDFYPAPPPP
jgi:hypothetical protein